MARSIWKGSIAFGLVNIPVSLTSAEVRTDINLHLVDSKNQARIRYERVNADTGEEVPWDRMVKGYEHDDGKFILLSEEDLEAVRPKVTKTIEITEFVSLDQIDPLLFEKPYYLEPEKRGLKAYALLREALRATGKAGIARVVIRTREYLTAMFVRDDVLVAMLLRFPEEIVSPSKLELPASADKAFQASAKEKDLAIRLIEAMTEEWKPAEFHDEYREALMGFIDKKVAGGESAEVSPGAEKAEEDTSGGKILDLADYLQRSFKNVSQGGETEAKPSAASTKPRTAQKHARTKVSTKKSSRKTA